MVKINIIKSNRIYIILILFITVNNLLAQVNTIIPMPQNVEYGNNEYVLEANLYYQSNVSLLRKEVVYKSIFSFKKISFNKSQGKSNIYIEQKSKLHESLGQEGYSLKIDKGNIYIQSSSDAGTLYAMQTLNQLIKVRNKNIYLPEIKILDKPRFEFRSFMLDESRYFCGEEFVKKLLDELCALKINKFHWHLTDNAGWRVESKKYPLLTEKGSWRKDSQINGWKSIDRRGEPHGGFYTQEQIIDIIEYAQNRNIDIIPEIEMPGHCSAAIAAYPWLGVLGNYTDVPEIMGRHEDSYDISNPRVIKFLHDIIDEMSELFPSNIIHIGGDEVLFDTWENSNKIVADMKRLNIETPLQYQIHFTNNMSKYISSKNEKMMCWFDDALSGAIEEGERSQLSKNSLLQFWDGEVELISKAAAKGYSIVNSSNKAYYLDYKYHITPIEKVYNFDPIPLNLEKKYHKNIIGLEAAMWTCWTPTLKRVENQIFPRIAAFAERAWSNEKNYKDFLRRVNLYSEIVAEKGFNVPFNTIIQ